VDFFDSQRRAPGPPFLLIWVFQSFSDFLPESFFLAGRESLLSEDKPVFPACTEMCWFSFPAPPPVPDFPDTLQCAIYGAALFSHSFFLFPSFVRRCGCDVKIFQSCFLDVKTRLMRIRSFFSFLPGICFSARRLSRKDCCMARGPFDTR